MKVPRFLCQERQKNGILVIEQEVLIHPLLQLALNPHGFEVKASSSFEQGLKLHRHHKSSIGLLLIGGSILQGDSEEVLAAFHLIDPNVAILVMTGNISAHNPLELYEQGVTRILAKPFQVGELIEVVTLALEKNNAAPSRVDSQYSPREESV